MPVRNESAVRLLTLASVVFTALAFACLDAFIPKYLYNFFKKDNSRIIKGSSRVPVLVYGLCLLARIVW